MAWTHEVLFLAIFLILFIVVSSVVQSKEMLIVEHLCGSSSPLFNLFLVFGKNLLNHCWSQQSTLNRTGKERAEEERKRDEVCVCVCVALSVFVLTACWQWQIENPSGLILSFSAPSNRKVVGVCVSVCVCVCACGREVLTSPGHSILFLDHPFPPLLPCFTFQSLHRSLPFSFHHSFIPSNRMSLWERWRRHTHPKGSSIPLYEWLLALFIGSIYLPIHSLT